MGILFFFYCSFGFGKWLFLKMELVEILVGGCCFFVVVVVIL